MREGGDEGQTIDPVGMTAGKCLGDGATHRIPHHRHPAHSESIEDPSHIVGEVLHLEAVPGERSEAVAAMVDHDHPILLGETGPDPIPLGE